jgi:hypothetical protein
MINLIAWAKQVQRLGIMEIEQKVTSFKERRAKSRRTVIRNYRVEIKLIGAPIYQFRVLDVSTDGAGILIKEDSKFLNLIEVGQIVDADFISPEGTDPAGNYKAEIRHITEPNEGKHKGHYLVGLSILEKIDQPEYWFTICFNLKARQSTWNEYWDPISVIGCGVSFLQQIEIKKYMWGYVMQESSHQNQNVLVKNIKESAKYKSFINEHLPSKIEREKRW